ncbi:hypothetical protein HID58_009595 [Brassica napus]|uniref:CGL160/ATPI domain-containing protein n=1 Tax=Brassica napus TaxID=3708 RepID=A0ABQ8DT96_BRANA|nr:hypothetical protein HID58_009595 [Brassica napus]
MILNLSFIPSSFIRDFDIIGFPSRCDDDDDHQTSDNIKQKLLSYLQLLTVGIGGVGLVSAYISYNTTPEITLIRMFGNTVDAMADGARGVMKGAAGQPRILVPQYEFMHLKLIPMLVGFFTYKVATFFQAIEEDISISTIKKAMSKSTYFSLYNKLVLFCVKSSDQTRSNVGLSVIFVKSSFVNIIELLTSLLNLFNIFLGASIVGNNNGRFVFSRFVVGDCTTARNNNLYDLVFSKNYLSLSIGFMHLKLKPMLVGFFTYKIATFFQAIGEAISICTKKNRCLKAPHSVYINKLDCCVLRPESNVVLSVIFVKSSFVNIIELLTSLLNLFNIFLGASIIGNNNGRFVFSRCLSATQQQHMHTLTNFIFVLKIMDG